MKRLSKKYELIFVLLFPLVVFILTFFFNWHINYLSSLFLMFGVPSLFLSFQNKEKVNKITKFSLMVSIPIAFIFELVSFGDQSWTVPQSIIPWRFFGFIPFEDLLWQFFTVYLIIMFYECFCRQKFQPLLFSRIKIMNVLLYSAMVIVMLIFTLNSSLISPSYAFLWLGLIFFPIQIIIFLFRRPDLVRPLIKVQIFFFYIHTMFELIGIKWSHWLFPGEHYIGWVNILSMHFPLEEFIFVMCIGAMAACVYYEYFANKRYL